jgi:D-amino peptidase
VKVYISVDMEGIAGVNHPGPTDRKHERYAVAVELMIGETNAAIEGAVAAGAADILVNDSHGDMYNLLPDRIHPAARVLQGTKPWSMVEGAGPDAGFGVALFVGYHARAGHPIGTLAHTYSGRPSKRDSMAGQRANTGSTPWRLARGVCRSAWSRATMRSLTRWQGGSRGPSGSS